VGDILAIAERAIYDCTRPARSQRAPQRNVMVMLSPVCGMKRRYYAAILHHPD